MEDQKDQPNSIANNQTSYSKISRATFIRGLAATFAALAFPQTQTTHAEVQPKPDVEYLPPMGVISDLVTKYRNESNARTQEQVKRDREYQPKPSDSIYATFLYLWSRNPLTNPENLINRNDRASDWSYWQDNGRKPPYDFDATCLPDITPGGGFDPRYGLYDSANTRVIEWQLSLLRKAKMNVAFVSWWGKDHRTDKVFKHIVKDEMKKKDTPNPKLRFGIVYEPDLRSERTTAEIEADFKYLLEEYGNEPEMLKINGKPVVFAYALGKNGPEKVAKISAIARELGIHYVAQVYNGYENGESLADDWIQYAPENRIDEQGNHSISISPGFNKRGDSKPRLLRKIEEFREVVKKMVASEARWKLVTTFNEIGEGTGVENAIPVIHKNGKAIPDPNGVRIGAEIDVLAEEIPDRDLETPDPSGLH